jgi:hypothetical protein
MTSSASWRKLSVGEAVTKTEGNGAESGASCVERKPEDLEKGVLGAESKYRK